MVKNALLSVVFLLVLVSAGRAQGSDAAMNNFVTGLMNKMTLDEKNRSVEFTQRR
ncbi:hypothetical protein LWM68_46495 [Niabella sp. W65]|nr:hypothetical protein [Niabella sp. W65]MCH7369527.1 hypothetical protein [Niabella sp. W65]ULT45063.1 hypothetical protein KRR40_18250 [Niabella sp. I65]